jgi:hypothetical protein
MSKFDDEVNKFLYEANFVSGLKTFTQGAEGLINTAASLAGASFSVNQDIYKFLDSINNDYSSSDRVTRTTVSKYDSLKPQTAIQFLSNVKEDPFKSSPENDLSSPNNILGVKNFLKSFSNTNFLTFKNTIKSSTKSIVGNLSKNISPADLNKFSSSSVSSPQNITDLNTYLKWIFSIHQGLTYKKALDHFFSFVLNSTESKT